MPVDFTMLGYAVFDSIFNVKQVIHMKVKTIRNITYSAFIIGALIMILAAALPVLSNYITLLMYTGGIIGFFGMVLCVVSLRFQSCPGCRDFVIIEAFSSEYCPCCSKEF